MTRLTIIFIAFAISYLQLGAQVAPDKYYVQFSDKDNSPYSINKPEEYLSQRAIDRRNAQGIAIDIRDLPVNPAYIAGVRNAGGSILNPTKWLNGVTIETDNASVINTISSLPYVVSVTKANVRSAIDPDTKEFFNNESYGDIPSAEVGMKDSQLYDYGQSFNQIDMVRGDELHAMGFRGEGMVIGVLDSGFDQADNVAVFDSLWSENRVLGTRDFVDGGPIMFDKHFHGTGVLSIMAGNYPGELIGTAPKASYYLLRTEDAATEYLIEEYNWVSGAEYADSVGCDVLNTSLGYSEFDEASQNHTYEDMDGNTTPITIGADIAASKGMILSTSAGNSGASAWFYITAPADGDSVLTVGAVNSEGTPWISSGNGPTSDGRIKPDVAAQGEGTYFFASYSGTFTWGNGTSLSSPIIAGMMACLWQSMPDKTNMEVIEMVKQSASLADAPDNKIGYGIPDFIEANLLTVQEQGDINFFEGISAYPNPFTTSVNLTFTASEPGVVNLSLVDLTGRKLTARSFTHNSGHNSIVLDELGDIPGGIYFLRLENANSAISAKLVKY